jgi:hypothetical protein
MKYSFVVAQTQSFPWRWAVRIENSPAKGGLVLALVLVLVRPEVKDVDYSEEIGEHLHAWLVPSVHLCRQRCYPDEEAVHDLY